MRLTRTGPRMEQSVKKIARLSSLSPALVPEAVLVSIRLIGVGDTWTHVAVVRPAVLVAVDFLRQAAGLAARQVIRGEVTRAIRRLRADGGPVHEDRGADHDLVAAGEEHGRVPRAAAGGPAGLHADARV